MDRIKGTLDDRLPAELSNMFPNGIPGTAKLQSIVDGLSQEELAAKVSAALSRVDQSKLTEFGQRIAAYGLKQGIEAPPGVDSGNPKAIGLMFARIAKSEKGINGTLRFLQMASSGRGIGGAAMSMTPFGRMRTMGLLGILSDPKMRSVIGPLISGLIKR